MEQAGSVSHARKCDKCGALFEPARGCVNIEQMSVVNGQKTKDGAALESGWSEIDLCLACSRPVIEALRGAANGIEKYLAKVGRK